MPAEFCVHNCVHAVHVAGGAPETCSSRVRVKPAAAAVTAWCQPPGRVRLQQHQHQQQQQQTGSALVRNRLQQQPKQAR
jgi:hypothetical protein